MRRPDPRRVVAAGYDAVATRYDEWSRGIVDDPRHRYVPALVARLEGGDPAILEIGSGSGSDSSRLLTERGRLTGIDISEAQVALARRRLPQATFVHGDVVEASFDAESFDAVVALYVLTHVPRADLPGLLRKVARWLRPGGLFLATLGASGEHDSYEQDWLGVPMFFSGFDVETNRRHLAAAGLDVIQGQVEVMYAPEPDEGEERFFWVLAQKPAAGPGGEPGRTAEAR